MLAALLPLLGPVLNKALDLIPDPQARAKAEAEALALLSAQQHEIARTVLEINKTEAGHRSIFVAGWRPSVGWVCSGAFAWHFLIAPMMTYLLAILEVTVPVLPTLDIGEIIGVLFALLGLGGFRTYEKRTGVSK